MTLFTDFVLDPETKFFYGWWFIGAISLMLFFNFGAVIVNNFGTLWLIGVKYARIIKNKFDKFIMRNDTTEVFS
jgi:hypothetical protein